MKRILLSLTLGLLVSGVTAQQAQAATITGAITFGGSVNLDTASAGTATSVTGWHGFGGFGLPLVVDADGDFATYVTPGLTTATFATPWLFESGAVAGFYTVGGFTFDLISSGVTAQGGSPAAVAVTGSGTLTGNGFETTSGTWSFSTQDPGARTPARFSFSAATSGVPEGGSSVVLLGMALIGAGILRKKLI